MSISILVPADVLPVSLTTALRHMRVLEQDADMATLYLQAAVEAVENYTGRSMVTKTYLLTLPGWSQKNLELRRSPLIATGSPAVAVSLVQYWAEGASALATLDPANYLVDTARLPGTVTLADGYSLPTLAKRTDALQITFTAGSGTSESTHLALMKAAVIMFARHLYDNQMPVMEISKIQEMPFSLKHMLRSQRIDSLTPQE